MKTTTRIVSFACVLATLGSLASFAVALRVA